MFQDASGCTRKLQEAPGAARSAEEAQDAPGGSRRLQKRQEADKQSKAFKSYRKLLTILKCSQKPLIVEEIAVCEWWCS